MTPEEQMAVIYRMVSRAKKNYSYSGNMFVVWGLATSVIAFLHYVMAFQFDVSKAQWIWFGMIVPGLVYSYQIRRSSRESVITYIDKIMGRFWLLSGLFMLSLLVMAISLGWQVIYPVFMMFLGFGACITGVFLKFKPLYFFGLIGWIIGLTAAFVPSEWLLVQLSVVALAAFAIPGFLLARSSNVEV